MNCDLVFEILTRGPFPAGDPTDATVELHLSSCFECRQLAEALRPATSLIHEALEHDCNDLPGYRGDLPVMTARPSSVASAVEAAIAEIARETTQQQGQPPVEVLVRKQPAWQRQRYASLPLSLALLAVALLAAVMVGMQLDQGTNNPTVPVAGSELAKEGNWKVVMAGLPLSCQLEAAHSAPMSETIRRSSVALLSQCCQCHVGQQQDSLSLALADHSAGLCLACHTN